MSIGITPGIYIKRLPCSIYAKINCDSFPNVPWNQEDIPELYDKNPVSGQDIYNFLMSDCWNAFPQEEDLTFLYNFPSKNKEWELQYWHGGEKYKDISPEDFEGNEICNKLVNKHESKELYTWYSLKHKTEVLSDYNPITKKDGNILYIFKENIDPCDHRLEGDKVIWYLCCCEKHGEIFLGDWERSWAWGESSPDIVKEFVDQLLNEQMINKNQYNDLLKEINFAKETFVLHYDIVDWLRHKKYGIPYNPDKSARCDSIAFHAKVNDQLEKEGYKIYTPNVNW